MPSQCFHSPHACHSHFALRYFNEFLNDCFPLFLISLLRSLNQRKAFQQMGTETKSIISGRTTEVMPIRNVKCLSTRSVEQTPPDGRVNYQMLASNEDRATYKIHLSTVVKNTFLLLSRSGVTKCLLLGCCQVGGLNFLTLLWGFIISRLGVQLLEAKCQSFHV